LWEISRAKSNRGEGIEENKERKFLKKYELGFRRGGAAVPPGQPPPEPIGEGDRPWPDLEERRESLFRERE